MNMKLWHVIGLAAFLVSNMGYASDGGNAAADINWLEKTPMPVPVGTTFGYAVVDNNIYIIGGDPGVWGNGSTTVQKYTIATDTWEIDTNNGGVLVPLPQPRSLLYCGVISRKIHCVGGWDQGVYKGDHFIYNPDTNEWSIGPPIPYYPIGQSAAVVNNKMYVFGGWWGTYTNSVFEYSEEGGWSSKSPMPTARNHVFTGTYNGKIFIIGGASGPGAQIQPLNVNEMYDPSSDAWSTGLSPMPTPVAGFGRAASGLPLLNGVIYFLWDEFAYAYNPLTNSWTTLNPLPGSAVGVAAINGSIYAIGTEHTFQGTNNVTPTLSINDVSEHERNHGKKTPFIFKVTLSSASTHPVRVYYVTANGTAKAGSDYTATMGMLWFARGQTTQVVKVDVSPDTKRESDETFFVNLRYARGATILDGQGLGTILNDD